MPAQRSIRNLFLRPFRRSRATLRSRAKPASALSRVITHLEDRVTPATFNLAGADLTLGVANSGDLRNGATMANYKGVEFFLAGTPYEEFAVSANGTVYRNYTDGGLFQIPGSTTMTTAGKSLAATFTGTAGGLSISRSLQFALDGSAVTFSIQVTNTTASTISNVQFLEAANPEQGTAFGGTSATANDVVTAGGGQFVRATQPAGTKAGYTVGFGSRDYRAVVSAESGPVGNPNNVIGSPVDPNGATGDSSIALALNFGTLVAQQAVVANYFLVFSDTQAGADTLFASAVTKPVVLPGYEAKTVTAGGMFAARHLAGIETDPVTGDLYVASSTATNSSSYTLHRVTSAGAVSLIGTYNIGASLPLFIMDRGPDGGLYFRSGIQILRINPADGSTSVYNSNISAAGTGGYHGLDFDPAGNLIYAQESVDRFYLVNPLVGATPGSGVVFLGSYSTPFGDHGDSFGVQPDGDYVVYPDNFGRSFGGNPNRVFQVDTTGHVTGSSYTIDYLSGTDINDLGNGFVYSHGTIDPVTGDVYTYGANSGNGSTTVVFSPENGTVAATSKLFVSNIGNGLVNKPSGSPNYDGRGATGVRFGRRTDGNAGNSLFILDDFTDTVYEVGIAITTTVSLAGGTLTVTDSTGVRNDNLTLSVSGTDLIITDPTANFATNAGSVSGDYHTVTVPLASVSSIRVNAAGGNDAVTLNASLSAFTGPITVDGGAGTDTVTVGAGVTLKGNGTLSAGLDLSAAGAKLNLDANAVVDFLSGVAGTTVELDTFELTAGDATNKTFSGSITGTGDVQKTGTGTWLLNGTNTYLPTVQHSFTRLDQGRLQVTGGSAIPNDSLVVVSGSSTFELLTDETIGMLDGDPGTSVILGGTLTFADTATGGANSYSGTISGPGGLTQNSNTQLILTGNNSYAGVTKVLSRDLLISHPNALGTTAGGTEVGPGGTLVIFSNNLTVTGEPLTLNGGGLQNYNGGTNTWTGDITLSAQSSIDGVFSVNSLILSGTISGPAGVVLNGDGNITLGGSAANTYGGTTTVNGGVVLLNKSSGAAVPGALTVIGGEVRVQAAGQIADGAAVSLSGSGATLTLLTNETVGSISGVAGSALNLNGNTLTTGGNGAGTTFAGVVSGTGGGLTKKGSGSFVLSNGSNSYTGLTTIDQGEIAVTANGALGGIAAGTVVNGGILDIQAASYATAEPVTLSGGILQSDFSGSSAFAGPITLTVGSTIDTSAATSFTVSGSITGPFSLTKSGGGKAILTGTNNDYTGTTLVSQGTLLVNGTLASGGGLVTVASGATLGGIGTISRPVTVNANGFLAPGTSPGVLNVGDYNQAGTLKVEIASASQFDQVNVTGSVALSGPLDITLGYTPTAGTDFILINNDGTADTVTGNFSGLVGGPATLPEGQTFTLGGKVFQITYVGGDGNDVALEVIPTVTIGDLTLAEGQSGTTSFVFTVTLSEVSTKAVTLSFATQDGTAKDGVGETEQDYTATLNTLTIPANTPSGTITVTVQGDGTFEPNETFVVNLSNATHAVITDAQATGAITNDDPQPTVAIGDVALVEGESGTANLVFTVTLSNPSYQDVTVAYATADGTAKDGVGETAHDYDPRSGALTILAGAVSGTIAVPVVGDNIDEANETFSVMLTSPTNATFTDDTAIGTITDNDDAPVGVADSASTDEETAVTGNVLTNDTDADDGQAALTAVLVSGPAHNAGAFTLNSNGSFSYTPGSFFQSLAAGQPGTDTFTYTASDGTNTSAVTTVTITVTGVNDAPVLTGANNFTAITEDDLANAGDAVSALIATKVSDADGSALQGIAVTGVVSGNGTWQYSLDNGTSWTPVGSVSGSSALLLRLADKLRFVPDGQNGTSASVSFRAWDQTGSTAGQQGTKVDATTNGNATPFSGGTPATANLTVSSVNDAPVAVADTADAVEAGGLNNTTAGTDPSGNVLTDDTDVDSGDSKTVSQVNGSAGNVGSAVTGSYGTLTLNADGTYTYVVANNNAAVQALRTSGQTLTDPFTYTMHDAAGAPSSTTLTVTIHGANDAPVATNDTATATEAGGVGNGAPGVNPSGNVLTNDTDVDSAANGETKSVTTTGALTGTYGTLTLNADGTYTYTVDNNNATVQALRTTANTLTDTFSHTMRDTAGATSTATLTVTIRGANDAPTDIALSNSSVAENAGANAVVGTLSATDADTGDTFTFSLPAGVGDNAAFNISGTQLRANASFDFETQSSYSATVRVTDQVGQTFDKLFTVTVTNVNEAPTIAAPASAFVLQNTNLTFTDISVADVDVGGGQLTVALTATHGTLTLGSTAGLSGLSGNNTAAVGFSGTLAAVNAALNGLTFHPEANYSGPASLGINVNDQGNTGTGGSLSAARTVAINVSPFPSVTNVQVGTPVAGFANQRSRIDQLVVTFSESLAQHPDAAFSLVRTGGPAVPLTVTWNADFSRATLTFSGPNVAGGSLTDGRYRLTVDGGQLITTSGQAIDGDGDHLGGGAFVLDFHRLFGDADGDADTDFTDLARFRQALGGPSVNPFIAYNPIFDSDGDGDVDFTDLAQFRQRLGTVLP